MQLRSLFLQSEMIFWRFGSEVTDFGDHILIQTSQNPTWRWGHVLLFPDPPAASDFKRWNEIHDEHFGPGVSHRLFVWDTPHGEIGASASFTESGFNLTRQPLLHATKLQLGGRPNEDVRTGPISENDWTEIVRINQEAFGEGDREYDLYIARKFELYRSMVNNRQGIWMGAWHDGSLVASCGVFHDNTISRYQEVVTSKDFRNRGICTRLVHDAFQLRQELEFPKTTLIAVDSDSQAERIYKRLGFENCEITCALSKTAIKE